MAGDVIYLDYAATSAVRPEPVIRAVEAYLRDVGATPGRAGHRRALDAGRVALRCRRALSALFGAGGDPGRIAFQLNATHALNVALFGVLKPGDRVVRTAYDHNAVRRPVGVLTRMGVEEVVLAGDRDGSIDLDEAERALSGGSAGKPARLLAIPHASNVLGTVLPVRELAERAHAAGALVLVDAAQSAGHVPINVETMGIDLLAFTGHKGLLGPQGTGGLWIRDGVDVEPLFSGGTGGDSGPLEMPSLMPDRLEAGTQNGPGLAGLLAGLEYLASTGGVEAVHERESRLKARLRERLMEIGRVRILSPAAREGVGIVTFGIDGVDASQAALRLDREHGVLVRSGLHCAPEAHAVLGSEAAGALRMSVGWATTEDDIERAADAVAEIAASPANAKQLHRAAGS